MINNNGSWIFISHSSADIEVIRIIRNEFEKYGQNPLAFHLKCLNTDTEENERELFDLIQREIEARDWFVYCESESAKKSKYVQMERDYVKQCKKQFIWLINLDQDIETIKEKVREICCAIQVYIIFSHKDIRIFNFFADELKKNDFSVWSDEDFFASSDWRNSMESQIANVSKRGFTLFICTPNTVLSEGVKAELKTAREFGSTIIAFSFGITLPEEYKEFIDWDKKCFIPTTPKDGDWYLLVDLVKAALSRKIVGAISYQADALNAEALLQEKLNYAGNYHSKEAVFIGASGATDDYIEHYQFPCCGKSVIVGDGPISRFRWDGCCKGNGKTIIKK